jgi:hypothetical protein
MHDGFNMIFYVFFGHVLRELRYHIVELLGSKIITGDEKLLEKIGEGKKKRILLIKDYELANLI